MISSSPHQPATSLVSPARANAYPRGAMPITPEYQAVLDALAYAARTITRACNDYKQALTAGQTPGWSWHARKPVMPMINLSRTPGS
jgi:hypothetical protein